MCDYCENEKRFDLDSSHNAYMCVEHLWRGPVLSFWNTIDGGVFGLVDVEATAQINYCPMCGRNLKEDEN